MRTITSLILVALIAAIGIVSAQDLINTDTYLVKDLVKPLNLSGTDFGIFATAYFNDEWVFIDSDSWTPSQNAFAKDNPEDGAGLGNSSPKRAYVGSVWLNKVK